MTRKDYVLIAAALAAAARNVTAAGMTDHTAHTVWQECAATVADALAQDNPRFDRERFLTACEVTA